MNESMNESRHELVNPVARFDDLSWGSVDPGEPGATRDRRPRLLRRWLPTRVASSRPLEGVSMARIKIAAYH
jgi:hypothetical protein